MQYRMFRRFAATALLCGAGIGAALAQPVEVGQAWIRATVQGQPSTGAFMQLKAKEATTLVAVSSPVAGVAEIHEMKMDGDIMRMRHLSQGLPLPAGKSVALAPGGFHIMLMNLKTSLPKDTTVPLTLTFRDAKGQEQRQELQLPVAVVAPGTQAGAAPAHKH